MLLLGLGLFVGWLLTSAYWMLAMLDTGRKQYERGWDECLARLRQIVADDEMTAEEALHVGPARGLDNGEQW